MKRNELIQQLHLEGFLTLEQLGPALQLFDRPANEDKPETSIYIRLLAGASAWFITALLVYLLRDLLFDYGWPSILIGIVSTAAALALSLIFRKNSFFKPLSIALVLFGQFMMIFGLATLDINEHLRYFLLLAYELALLIIFPAFVVRFVATCLSLIVALVWLSTFFPMQDFDVFVLLIAFCMPLAYPLFYYDSEWLLKRIDPITRPAAYALVLMTHIALLYMIVIRPFGFDPSMQFWFWALFVVLFGLIVWQLSAIVHSSFSWSDRWVWLLLGLLDLACLAAWQMPALLAPIGLLLLAKQRGERVLFYFASIFLLIFLGYYYYSLELTLLEKSLTLLGTGGLLLVLRSALRYVATRREVLS